MLFTDFAVAHGVLSVTQQPLNYPDAQAVSDSLAANSITPNPPVPSHITLASDLVDLLPAPFPTPPPKPT